MPTEIISKSIKSQLLFIIKNLIRVQKNSGYFRYSVIFLRSSDVQVTKEEVAVDNRGLILVV